MDQGQEPNHFDHPCNDTHRLDSEEQCRQEDYIPPNHHHGIGEMSARVEVLSESSYVLKTMKDEDGSVQALL
jgi:hypothetical protein